MITVYFPKYLRSLTDGVESQKFDTKDVTTLVEGLRTLFPKLSLHVTQIQSQQINNICYLMDKDTKELLSFNLSTQIKAESLVLLITLYGQGDDFAQIAIGAALIAASFIPGLQGIGVMGLTLTGTLFSMGLSAVVGGFLGMLTPDATSSPNAAPDAAIRAQNDSFAGLQNTTTTDQAVPLIFGLMRVPGQFVGGRIRTINHDAYTVIKVANYV